MDLCMSSWQAEFGGHVFCSLACWDGGRDKGDRWAIATGSHRLETPCPLPAFFPLIFPPFPGAMELGKHFGEGIRATGWFLCSSVRYTLSCWAGASPAGSCARGFNP